MNNKEKIAFRKENSHQSDKEILQMVTHFPQRCLSGIDFTANYFHFSGILFEFQS